MRGGHRAEPGTRPRRPRSRTPEPPPDDADDTPHGPGMAAIPFPVTETPAAGAMMAAG